MSVRVRDRTTRIQEPAAPVLPSAAAIGRLNPLGGQDVAITGGFWADRLRDQPGADASRTASTSWAGRQPLDNLRLAAGRERQLPGHRRTARGPPSRSSTPTSTSGSRRSAGSSAAPPTRTSRGGRRGDRRWSRRRKRPTATSTRYVQVVGAGPRVPGPAWGHELYCVGHLIQAAVAWHRALRRRPAADVAVRAADSIDAALGPGGRDGVDGHPEIEMALVELYRVTGERALPRPGAPAARAARPRAARARTVRRRLLAGPRAGPRGAPTVAGHAVRQLYLDCGAVDVAVETGRHGAARGRAAALARHGRAPAPT